MNKVAERTFAASDAKNNFGKLINAAQRNPVMIEKHGRPVAYVVSPVDMEAMEDFRLGMRAMEVMKNSTSLGVEETRKFFDEILHGRH